jgi:hypothetical protein
MYIFVIDAENRVTAHVATKPIRFPKDVGKFADERELAGLIADWRLTRLVEIWNKLPNVKHVVRFADRRIAVKRIWGAVQNLESAPRRTPGRSRSPLKTDPVRYETKTERIIALLKRSSGATIDDIMAETGWQRHSVRGFISGQLSKRLGFLVESFKGGDERIYRIMKGKTT